MSFVDDTDNHNKFNSIYSESYVTTGRSFIDDHLKSENMFNSSRNNINGSDINILYQDPL